MSDIDTKTVLEVVEIMKGVKSLLGATPNPYLPVYSALGGAFVGAVATFIPTTITTILKEKKETKTLTLAIYAEIKAIIELIEKRSYFETTKTIVDKMEKGLRGNSTYQIIVPEEYCVVYKNNIASIGKLDSALLVKIVMFYQLIDAVIQDVKPGGLLNTAPRGVEPFKELLAIGTHMVAIGQEIVEEIDKKFGLKTLNTRQDLDRA